MDSSFITGQVQSVMQQLMFDLIEKLLQKMDGGTQSTSTGTTSSTATSASTSSSTGSSSSTQTGALPSQPAFTIGGLPATVWYAGVVSPGLYQFNVGVPSTVAGGDATVAVTYGGGNTPAGALISVAAH